MSDAGPSVGQGAEAAQASRDALHVLCAGAAQGFLTRLEQQFVAQTGVHLATHFGAVGALREALLAGTACDVLIVTDAMVTDLGASGHLHAETRAVLGRVRTGLAVREGEPAPDIADGSALARTLCDSSAIHYPDPRRATAGVHFTEVLRKLGVLEQLAARCHTYANGATAMRALAASQDAGHLGCTQISEIMFTPGIRLLGGLPRGYELVTTYSAAAMKGSMQPSLVQALMSLLDSAQTKSLRAECGIEPQDVG